MEVAKPATSDSELSHSDQAISQHFPRSRLPRPSPVHRCVRPGEEADQPDDENGLRDGQQDPQCGAG